jgi:pyroglutamyl-peptidase
VAGFDAFDNLDSNPSQIVVEALGSSIKLPGRKGEVLLDTLVLPTCCNKAWGKLKRKLDGNRDAFDAVILTGVAAKREKISLERFALNIRDYRIKDNGGHQYLDELIEKGAPDALKTGLSLAAMSKALAQNGVLCEVSNHAGTFICNEVYFKCLRYQEKQANPAKVLFVHLPLPRTYSKSLKAAKLAKSEAKGQGITKMLNAVEQIIALSL